MTFRQFRSHGDGTFRPEQFARIGKNVIFEAGVLVFHPERISLGDNVYIGHQTILKGYHRGDFTIGNDTWIGQGVFLHAAGGLTIGNQVGIGPQVRIITSMHAESGPETPFLESPLRFAQVIIEDNCDIGIGAIILPGVTIRTGTQVGAGAVVTADSPSFSVMVGVPARLLRSRQTP